MIESRHATENAIKYNVKIQKCYRTCNKIQCWEAWLSSDMQQNTMSESTNAIGHATTYDSIGSITNMLGSFWFLLTDWYPSSWPDNSFVGRVFSNAASFGTLFYDSTRRFLFCFLQKCKCRMVVSAASFCGRSTFTYTTQIFFWL